MKSFRVYLPGGREVSSAGLVVVALAAAAMIVGAFYLDEIARVIPKLTISQAKYLLIVLGLLVIGIGWLALRLAGVPFAKKDADPAARANAAQRPS